MRHLTIYLLITFIFSTPAKAEKSYRPELLQSGMEWTFQSCGETLKGRKWLPADSRPKAVLIAVHGTQTHAGWFGALAQELTQNGWAVYAPDRRGSGLNLKLKSNRLPEPVDINHWHQWLMDLDVAVGQVRANTGGAPVYLLGSSWGTSLTTAYMDTAAAPGKNLPRTQHAAHLAGHILSVPAGISSQVPRLAKKAEVFLIGGPLRLLGKIIPPLNKISTTIGLPAETYSQVPEVVSLIQDEDITVPADQALVLKPGQQDPHLIHRATYRFFWQSSAMRRQARASLENRVAQAAAQPRLLCLLSAVDDIANNEQLRRHYLPATETQILPETDHSVQLLRPDLMAAHIHRWHEKN